MATTEKPVIIIGAGVSGLLLAQHLQKRGIPFRIFERDADLDTRGLGWGLTLHWSLPALKKLLPPALFDRLPESYVDRAAVENGEPSTFPFFDLSSGELRASTPNAPSSQRVRVTRDRLRGLLATDIDIQVIMAGPQLPGPR
jgi:flavin-dependent dehydrogenase